jgi:hypothetical protein
VDEKRVSLRAASLRAYLVPGVRCGGLGGQQLPGVHVLLAEREHDPGAPVLDAVRDALAGLVRVVAQLEGDQGGGPVEGHVNHKDRIQPCKKSRRGPLGDLKAPVTSTFCSSKGARAIQSCVVFEDNLCQLGGLVCPTTLTFSRSRLGQVLGTDERATCMIWNMLFQRGNWHSSHARSEKITLRTRTYDLSKRRDRQRLPSPQQKVHAYSGWLAILVKSHDMPPAKRHGRA